LYSENGILPVSNSHRTTPYDQTSQAELAGCVAIISGLIHAQVPTTFDITVVFSKKRDNPKSHILQV